jgi:hypothetical protein
MFLSAMFPFFLLSFIFIPISFSHDSMIHACDIPWPNTMLELCKMPSKLVVPSRDSIAEPVRKTRVSLHRVRNEVWYVGKKHAISCLTERTYILS